MFYFYHKNKTVTERVIGTTVRVGDNEDIVMNPECTNGAPITRAMYDSQTNQIYEVTCSDLNGRYISLDNPGPGTHVTLCELKAFACGG